MSEGGPYLVAGPWPLCTFQLPPLVIFILGAIGVGGCPFVVVVLVVFFGSQRAPYSFFLLLCVVLLR